MQEVTAIDAAKLTGHSEKTIRRWILSGKLPARLVSKNRYAIKTSDLRKYIPEAQPDLSTALARIQELESTQDTLIERIERLEALVTSLSNGHRPDKKVTEAKPLVKQRVLINGDENNQDDNQAERSEGAIIMAQFARENGLNRRTVQDWIMQGKVEATTIEGKHYLTPDQQQAMKQYIESRKK
jgi:predicted site-specific integrase-resolvase